MIIPAEGYAQRLAQVSPCPHYDDRQNENAKLIAAAPDLLQDLQNLIEITERGLNNPDKWGDMDNAALLQSLIDAKETIKKATL